MLALLADSYQDKAYATDLISRGMSFHFPRIPITRGTVVNAPTTVRAIPAAFWASLVNVRETSIPMPAPKAMRVPVHKIISGTVIFRSIVCLRNSRCIWDFAYRGNENLDAPVQRRLA